MITVVRDPHPVEFDALLTRRRQLGLDHSDEIWEGVLHMNPAPHGRHHRIGQQLAELLGPPATAAGLVPAIGIFNLGEPEVLIVDPEKRSVSWLTLIEGKYDPIERSDLIDLGGSELAEQIDWS